MPDRTLIVWLIVELPLSKLKYLLDSAKVDSHFVRFIFIRSLGFGLAVCQTTCSFLSSLVY